MEKNSAAVQYLVWALEEIERLDRPKTARQVRVVLGQLGLDANAMDALRHSAPSKT
jgi:hypothetical protein